MHRVFTPVAHAGRPDAARPASCSTRRSCASTPSSNPTDPTISRAGSQPCSRGCERRQRRITPNWPWRRDPTPYVGGDPINYLKFARGMRNFYAAHVREPMFPAVTRIGLMFTGDAGCRRQRHLDRIRPAYARRDVRTGSIGRIADGRVGGRRDARHRSERRVLGDRRLARRAVRLLRHLMHVGMAAVRPPPDTRECRARRRAQWRRVSDENHDDRTHRSGSRVAARHERGEHPSGVGHRCRRHDGDRRAVSDQLRHRDRRSVLRHQQPH